MAADEERIRLEALAEELATREDNESQDYLMSVSKQTHTHTRARAHTHRGRRRKDGRFGLWLSEDLSERETVGREAAPAGGREHARSTRGHAALD